MKPLLFLVLLFLSLNCLAGIDPTYRLAGDFRSFLNPGTVCPFCVGSPFFALGYRWSDNAQPYHHSISLAMGSDNAENLHGAWDVLSTTAFDHNIRYYSYSTRYAYKFNFGIWKLGLGARLRADNTQVHQSDADIVPVPHSSNVWTMDADAGFLFTNIKGTYIGASALHLFSPAAKSVTAFVPCRNYYAQGGTVIPLAGNWDMLAEADYRSDLQDQMLDAGGFVRYRHRWAAGFFYATGDQCPPVSMRASYTTTRFKWQCSVEPSALGWSVETGLIVRLIPKNCNAENSCNAAQPLPVKAEEVR